MSRFASRQWWVTSVWKAKLNIWEGKRAEKMEKNGPLDQSTSVLKWIISFQSDYFVLVPQLSNLRKAKFRTRLQALLQNHKGWNILSKVTKRSESHIHDPGNRVLSKRKGANVNPMKLLELEWEPFHLLLSDSKWTCLLFFPFERKCSGNF